MPKIKVIAPNANGRKKQPISIQVSRSIPCTEEIVDSLKEELSKVVINWFKNKFSTSHQKGDGIHITIDGNPSDNGPIRSSVIINAFAIIINGQNDR